MVVLTEKGLTLDDCERVLLFGDSLELDRNIVQKVEKNHQFLKDFSKNKLIYGINTGFGPMAPCIINENDQNELQHNLIYSHCSGTGNPIDSKYVRALMLARLSSLSRGFSGIHTEVLEVLVSFINENICPVIYEHGSVGASGDLVQLAHLALALIGEGEVIFEGKIRTTSEVLKEKNIQPIKIHVREALALLNGTSAMSGIGLINLIHAKNLVNWMVYASCLINEIVEAYDDHFSEELNSAKRHKGQQDVAKMMRIVLNDSKLIRKRDEHLYNKKIEQEVLKDKVQEYYSIRCVPQIVGPILDSINFADNVVIDEINSANDNPIVDSVQANVFHGGNFHGDYVSLEMDKLKIAITKLSMLSERQLNYLLNSRINKKLPPFINLGKLGLNFGMQGVQFTATSTVAENQTLSYPMYLHSISCNNDNQDIVSMGTNSALLTSKVIENTFQVLAIEFMALVQAVDALDSQDKISSTSLRIYKRIRKILPKFEKDLPKYKEIKGVRDFLVNEKIEISV